ncbi:MAG: helix-turn-helix transcriptional regulator [archaeon]
MMIKNWWNIKDTVRQSENIKLDDAFFNNFLNSQIAKYNNKKNLAKATGISRPLLTKWTKGKQRPSIGTLKKILNNLNVNYSFLNDKWRNINFPINLNQSIILNKIIERHDSGYRVRFSPIESELIKHIKYCKFTIENLLTLYLKVTKDDITKNKVMIYIPYNISNLIFGYRKIEIKEINYDTYLRENTKKYIIKELTKGYIINLRIGANYNIVFPVNLLRRLKLVTGDIVYIKVKGTKEGFFIRINKSNTDFMIKCYKNEFKIGEEVDFYLEKANNFKSKKFNFLNLININKKLVNIEDNGLVIGTFSRSYGNQIVKLKRNIKFSRQFGWLIGFWLAEGSKQCVNFSIFSTKYNEILKIIKILEPLININLLKIDVYYNNFRLDYDELYKEISKLRGYKNLVNKIFINKTYTTLGYQLWYNSVFQKLIKDIVKETVKDTSAFPNSFLIGILEGVIQGDGHIYNKSDGYKNIIIEVSERNPEIVKFYINLFSKLKWIKNTDYKIIIRALPRKNNAKIINKTSMIFDIPVEQLRIHKDIKSKNIYYCLNIKVKEKILKNLYNIKFGDNVDFNKIKEHIKGG